MSNKAVSRRFIELYAQQHDVEGCTPLFAETAVIYSNTAPGPVDREGYKQVGYGFLAGFPDLTAEIIDQIEEGDRVVTRVQWSGTNSGSLNGMPVTGKRFSASGMTIDKVENGLITERWELGDLLSMMQQLGLAPTP
jgi:steroid delta-isomerase-like uncharacterized protein